MGRDLHYIPGSFYRVDDRTGFPTRAERTRKEWQNLIVDERVWEPRQPQDLVKGVPDYQSVPEARPLAPAQFVGPIFIQIAANVAPMADTIELQNLAGIRLNDEIGVIQADGSVFNTVVVAFVDASTIQISAGVPLGAPSGNLVQDYRIQGGTTPTPPSPPSSGNQLDFSNPDNLIWAQ